MTESPEVPTSPVVALLESRRAELLGGVDSIGEQRRRADELEAQLDEVRATIAACEAEVAEIDHCLSVIAPTPEPEPDPEPESEETP